MTATLYREKQVVLAGGVHRSHDVGCPGTSNDDRWSAVDHRVPHRASVVVPLVVGFEYLAVNPLAQLIECPIKIHRYCAF